MSLTDFNTDLVEAGDIDHGAHIDDGRIDAIHSLRTESALREHDAHRHSGRESGRNNDGDQVQGTCDYQREMHVAAVL